MDAETFSLRRIAKSVIEILRNDKSLSVGDLKDGFQVLGKLPKRLDMSDLRWHGGGNSSILNGGISKTTNYTPSLTDSIIYADSNITITLPNARNMTGKEYIIKRRNVTGNVTVQCTGSETIDGDPYKLLAFNYSSMQVISDGANWNII